MARELKKILNQRIGLSAVIDEISFEEKFANGFLLGEILSKFGLQPDFAFFQDLQDEETKIRNFARIIAALEDVDMILPFPDVQKIMQACLHI
ncbi:hypothetical protein BV898_01625 [Hypsibius exemplaris]|uniref:CH-like domain-containing protein n=1 Tax=Hypsibius exemplaris TaxID=2072580 RepID=A0A1W0XAL0_HYPEX|nr:hypothetical protein BV898_01625 [Hypsibius exemplaris]